MKINKKMKQHYPIQELVYCEYFTRPEDENIYIMIDDKSFVRRHNDVEGKRYYEVLLIDETHAKRMEFNEDTEVIPIKIDEIDVSEYDFRTDY